MLKVTSEIHLKTVYFLPIRIKIKFAKKIKLWICKTIFHQDLNTGDKPCGYIICVHTFHANRDERTVTFN